MRWTLSLISAGMLVLAVASHAQAEESLPKLLPQLELAKELAQLELASLAKRPLYERASRWTCEPSSLGRCDKDGCSRGPGVATVKLDFREKKYSRCDGKACDDYPLEFTSSGVFTTATPQRPGIFIKILNDGSEYIEVATLWLWAYVNFGACRPHDTSD